MTNDSYISKIENSIPLGCFECGGLGRGSGERTTRFVDLMRGRELPHHETSILSLLPKKMADAACLDLAQGSI